MAAPRIIPEISKRPMSTRHLPLTAYACLAASMTLVGSYVGLSKWLIAAFPLFLLAWLRFAMAALVMVRWTWPIKGEPPLSRETRRLLFWESFLGNFLFSLCMLAGVGATSALAAGVVMATLPATVALLSWVFLREALTRRHLISVGLAVLGVMLLVWARSPAQAVGQVGQASEQAPWWGYVLLIAAVFCEASYVVIGKRLTAEVSPQRISALINLWGLALVTPLGLWQGWNFDFQQVKASHWLLLSFYSVAASVVTVKLWMQGLRGVPASQAGVFTIFLPMAAALVGVWGLGEVFGALHAMAFGTALAGLLVATWPARGEPAAGATSHDTHKPPHPGTGQGARF